jgi:hypothetical protein
MKIETGIETEAETDNKTDWNIWRPRMSAEKIKTKKQRDSDRDGVRDRYTVYAETQKQVEMATGMCRGRNRSKGNHKQKNK